MKSKRFTQWLQNIITTQDEEISCSECFDLVSRYVDMEFSSADPSTKMSQVKQHLSQCPTCREEYEILHDLRQMEEEHATPSVEDLRNKIQ